MDSFQSIVLGIVQGFTEFLPVSSSGHLVIAQTLLGVANPGVFIEVALHVGTLISVMIVYRKKLAALATGAIRNDPGAWRYLGFLILASIPAGLVGILLKDRIEAAFGAPWVTGVLLIVTGGILWTTRRARPALARSADGGELAVPLGNDPGVSLASPTGALTWKLALGIGLAQAVAILPGISRSGSTIAAGLWGRLGGEEAAEFSFLMSIIVIAGAALLEVRHFSDSVQGVGAGPLIMGFLVSIITGIIAIQSLVWLLRKQAFHLFAYYVWGVGALFLIYLGLRG